MVLVVIGLSVLGAATRGARSEEAATEEAVISATGEALAEKPKQTLPPIVAWDEPMEPSKDYQNLRLLQHLEGPQIERIMGFFAETMGQKCTFCHNIRDYAADEKPTKAKGRKMLEMVQHLNRQWFEAERITCYTCHDATAEVVYFPEGITDLPGLEAYGDPRQLPEDYVNVQRLQHLTESEYDRVMDFFVQSLGQESCRFCHNIRDYASDEKPEKVTARKMISMVQDVSTRGWSEKRVTCYTCHIGEEHPRQFPEGWIAEPIPGEHTPQPHRH